MRAREDALGLGFGLGSKLSPHPNATPPQVYNKIARTIIEYETLYSNPDPHPNLNPDPERNPKPSQVRDAVARRVDQGDQLGQVGAARYAHRR